MAKNTAKYGTKLGMRDTFRVCFDRVFGIAGLAGSKMLPCSRGDLWDSQSNYQTNLSTTLEPSCNSRSEASPDRLNSGPGWESRLNHSCAATVRCCFSALGSERPLSQAIAEVDTAKGLKQLEAYLEKRPYPHYKPVQGKPDLLRRVEADGTETIGRFVDRQFVEVGNEH